MQVFKKTIRCFVIGFILTGFNTSCFVKRQSSSLLYSQLPEKKEIPAPEDEKPLEKENQEEGFVCSKEGRGCWEFSECRGFCENLFFGEDSREMCYQWPISLYEDFENLFITIYTKPFRYIDPKVLKCFVKLSENNKTTLFKKFNQEETLEFLGEIAKSSELAFHLSGEDKGDFFIFRTLFKKISSRIPRAVKRMSTNKGNFLILLHEYQNYHAWLWLDDYIIHGCRRDSLCKEPLDYYCEVLEDVFSATLEDFFENQYFKNEYRKAIESKQCGSQSCEYGDVRDFREMCDNF